MCVFYPKTKIWEVYSVVSGGPTEGWRLRHRSLFIYTPASYKDLLQVLCACVPNRMGNTYSNMAYSSIKIKIEKNVLINMVDYKVERRGPVKLKHFTYE